MINYIAVIVATLVSFALGAVWYSPVLFGNQWMKLNGFTKSDMKKADMTKGMIVSLLGSLLASFVLARLFMMLEVTAIGMALHSALGIWIAFIVPMQLSRVFYEKGKIGLFYIHTFYSLTLLLVTALILVVWR